MADSAEKKDERSSRADASAQQLHSARNSAPAATPKVTVGDGVRNTRTGPVGKRVVKGSEEPAKSRRREKKVKESKEVKRRKAPVEKVGEDALDSVRKVVEKKPPRTASSEAQPSPKRRKVKSKPNGESKGEDRKEVNKKGESQGVQEKRKEAARDAQRAKHLLRQLNLSDDKDVRRGWCLVRIA